MRATEPEEADEVRRDAKALEQAGAFALVLEKVPASLATEVAQSVRIPVIGIGAGPNCDGQILVSHDMEEAIYLADKVLMLTRRPTRIADVVPFTAPRPRHPETLTAPEFVRAKAHCLDVFQREVRRAP